MPASRARRWKDGAIRKLVWFHRWLGLASCLIFALWFASGAVLLFEPFPSLAPGAARALAKPIQLAALRISPAEALARAGGGSELRLRERAGVPVYIVGKDDRLAVIDGRDGHLVPLLNGLEAASVLNGRAGPVAGTRGPFDYDQWIVHNQFDPLRPFYRVDLADDARTSLYVSARTGEIVQRTTRRQRAWNWIGAVLHWAYFTPLRSSFSAWDRSVWIVSFIAMLVATAGMVLGVIRTMAVRRARRPGLTFYRLRWMRWHHLMGLFAGIFVLTWILSGWLSMDHGRLFSRGRPAATEAQGYAGAPLADVATSVPLETLRRLPAVGEVRFTAIAGVPLMAVSATDGSTRLWSTSAEPVPVPRIRALVARGLSQGWRSPWSSVATPVPVDDLYSLAEGMPASAERFAASGGRPPVYVDVEDGRILTVMSGSRAAYTWIYYALHSFNFPGVARHQLLRDVLVLIPLIAGFLFSLTGVVLGWQRLRKSISA